MVAAPMFGGLPLAYAPIASIPALTHYSDRLTSHVYAVGQLPEPAFKPRGLWVSVDEGGRGWPHYIEDEASWATYRLRVVHDVRLAPRARVLLLASAADFDSFAAQYGARLPGSPPGYFDRVDWKSVAAAYQGIVIAPYRYDRRYDGGLWYYTWDVASGCIWDADAIAAITVRSAASAGVAA